MKINLNFIKIIFLSISINTVSHAVCPGCEPTVTLAYKAAATAIDSRHKQLELTVKSYYESNILPLLKDIDDLQLEITKISVHMKALEIEANVDEKKLLHLLEKTASFTTLIDGDVE